MAKLYNYINFDNCQDAFKYYEKVFGATGWSGMPYTNETMGQMGMSGIDLDKSTVHGHFIIGGQIIMCSDALMGKAVYSKVQSMFLNFNTEDAADMAELDELYTRITAHPDTVVEMPLADQFWGDKMGTIVDKYGITWTLYAQPYSQLDL